MSPACPCDSAAEAEPAPGSPPFCVRPTNHAGRVRLPRSERPLLSPKGLGPRDPIGGQTITRAGDLARVLSHESDGRSATARSRGGARRRGSGLVEMPSRRERPTTRAARSPLQGPMCADRGSHLVLFASRVASRPDLRRIDSHSTPRTSRRRWNAPRRSRVRVSLAPLRGSVVVAGFAGREPDATRWASAGVEAERSCGARWREGECDRARRALERLDPDASASHVSLARDAQMF